MMGGWAAPACNTFFCEACQEWVLVENTSWTVVRCRVVCSMMQNSYGRWCKGVQCSVLFHPKVYELDVRCILGQHHWYCSVASKIFGQERPELKPMMIWCCVLCYVSNIFYKIFRYQARDWAVIALSESEERACKSHSSPLTLFYQEGKEWGTQIKMHGKENDRKSEGGEKGWVGRRGWAGREDVHKLTEYEMRRQLEENLGGKDEAVAQLKKGENAASAKTSRHSQLLTLGVLVCLECVRCVFLVCIIVLCSCVFCVFLSDLVCRFTCVCVCLCVCWCVVAPTPDDTLATPAPVIEYAAPAHTVTFRRPSPVTEDVAPAPAVTNAAPVIQNVAPSTPDIVNACVAPAPVIENIAPSPVFWPSFSQKLPPLETNDVVGVDVGSDRGRSCETDRGKTIWCRDGHTKHHRWRSCSYDSGRRTSAPWWYVHCTRPLVLGTLKKHDVLLRCAWFHCLSTTNRWTCSRFLCNV